MSTKSQKILIYSDEETTRDSLKYILGDKNELIITEDSEQCLACLENNDDIKLIILNIQIENNDAIHSYQKIKNNNPAARILILSRTDFEDLRKALQSLEPKEHILQPFEPEDILLNI